MKCQKCEESGLKSRVYIPQSVMVMPCGRESFYDEDGLSHYHDGGIRSAEWHCSNGHHWNVKHRVRCPVDNCDWNQKEYIVPEITWE